MNNQKRYIILCLVVFMGWSAYGSASEGIFQRNLSFGMRGDANVSQLQKFLTDNAYYTGPVNGNFFALTKEAVIKYQKANNIVPATGYFGPMTRASINSKLTLGMPVSDKSAQIQALQAQIDALLKQLAILQSAGTVSAPAPALEPATTTPAVPEVVTSPPVATTTPAVSAHFESTLRISSTYPSYTLTRFSAVLLGEFQFSANEKMTITKVRFTNVGTLSDENIAGLQLINSRTGAVVATTTLDHGAATFIMVPDAHKNDQGLIVSGGAYQLVADNILSPHPGVRYTIEFDIQSASDISAFDYNDLTRAANITQQVFPVAGTFITTY